MHKEKADQLSQAEEAALGKHRGRWIRDDSGVMNVYASLIMSRDNEWANANREWVGALFVRT
ncbi:MAG: hypothetical protein EBZ48_14150 [Proteobacteria bacterium]|nr:hypothetical protein [Pseudomonadota bacterium]